MLFKPEAFLNTSLMCTPIKGTECQTRKIRCNVGPENPTCSRCQRMGLRCVVNKSLQSLLEDESEYVWLTESSILC